MVFCYLDSVLWVFSFCVERCVANFNVDVADLCFCFDPVVVSVVLTIRVLVRYCSFGVDATRGSFDVGAVAFGV